jgi:oxygen-independent coproporphyrinogen-3 oxidase
MPKAGDELAMGSTMMEVVKIDGSGNGLGIAKVKAFNNAKFGVEFIGIKVKEGGCIYAGQAKTTSLDFALLSQTQREELEKYYERIENNEFPIFRGHILTQEDEIIRRHILNLMCQFSTSWEDEALYCDALNDSINSLKELEKDELIIIASKKITITQKGKPFIRNICMALDVRMKRQKPETALFSMTI